MNRLAIFGLVVVVLLVVVALFAPLIATHDVGATDLTHRFLPPSAEHLFGTDATGRDIFSRVVFGARISLRVGLVVVVVSSIVGIIIGALAGYYGGWIDRLISGYLFNVFLAFPGLLLAIAMVAFLGAGLNKLIFALCVIGWVGYARVMRGQVLKVREYDFVQAARADTRSPGGLVDPGTIANLLIRAHQAGMQVVPDADAADVVIVNTCSFIDSSKEESIGHILDVHQSRGMKKRRKHQKLIVAGCMSQRFSKDLTGELHDEVDAFIGLDQGATSVFGSNTYVHEFVHDARHFLGFPCH